MNRRKYIDDDPGVVLPITPMLDMAFQLLAFFIFTYHPSDLEGQMELNLPDKPEASAEQVPDNPTPSMDDKDPMVDADISVIVRTFHDGEKNGDISQILVKEGPDEVEVKREEQLVKQQEALLKELTKRREGLSNKEGIKVQAEGGLKWEKFVAIMDTCRKAGFKDVGFAPPPDLVPGL